MPQFKTFPKLRLLSERGGREGRSRLDALVGNFLRDATKVKCTTSSPARSEGPDFDQVMASAEQCGAIVNGNAGSMTDVLFLAEHNHNSMLEI